MNEQISVVTLPKFGKFLGYAGLLPQAIILALVTSKSEWQWVALATGWAYAALIFSFLGGVWWGLALVGRNTANWLYVAAVAPSLIAIATYIPWTLGWNWPGPSLAVLGLCLVGSPLIDRSIGQSVVISSSWMTLRWILSLGLGGMTLMLSTLS